MRHAFFIKLLLCGVMIAPCAALLFAATDPDPKEPVFSQPFVQEPGTENINPPFYVNPLSQSVRMARDRIQQMRSPVEQNEAATVDPGPAPSPTGLGPEAASR